MFKNKQSESPQDWYARALKGGFVADRAQEQAIQVLTQSHQAIMQAHYAQGSVYLWGPVGRGKTWLMDNFFAQLAVPAKRQHFHHFMQWLHQRLNQLSGTANPLQRVARELAAEIKVLCFDEVFVNDIADAILLGSVFQVLFEHGLAIIMTSNQPPHELYIDGFNRERFLPAIAAIEKNMQVVAVDGGQDHRLHEGDTVERYWVRQAEQASVLPQLFKQLNQGEAAKASELNLAGRAMQVLGCSERILYCDFAELCMQPFSALDFIELCDRFDSVLLANVPRLTSNKNVPAIARGTEDAVQQVQAGERKLPRLTRLDDAVRRFIALIDECYDRKVVLYIEAQVPMENLYMEGYLSFAFRRAYSRLREMQLRTFSDR
ncbi:cell division protein ZapE [Thiopseudomonas acetoxidans]|uniref:Cell division protein ZapE n=1 Tax=Thiopseudomonas acetoxidans TaxID=3041622 RepID=A0ABT7SNN6_9GAMM|nr:cell division protein ZapE [Thiopseudomonas sp. CY1220]MDM7857129.1 cell division protein ZapE [Thiopseudomonas sp. CY1220]